MKRNFCVSIIAGLIFVLSLNKAVAQIKPETMRQIQSLLDEKSSRTSAQRKIQSSLLQASRENRGEKMAENVELLPAIINKDASGKVKVDINGDITESLLAKITALGGEIIFPSKEYNSLRALVPLSKIETIADYTEVKFIQTAILSKTAGTPNKNLRSSQNILPLDNKKSSVTLIKRIKQEHIDKVKKNLEKYLMILGSGSVNSQGDHSHRADDARNTYGYAGQGIKIGVLSDSYNNLGGAAADVINGDLPGVGNPVGNTTPVKVLADYTNNNTAEDEGRAMLQIVHDLAPKAQLYFATGNISEASFATNIKALRDSGCDIVIDDLGYYDEPVFQDGVVAKAVAYVILKGGMYFSSAGNEGNKAFGTSGVWEGDFNDVGSPAFTTGTTKTGTIHNFGSTPTNGDSVLTIASGVYDLQWADPWGASSNDYDLFMVSSTGAIKYSSTNLQNGTQNPYESFAPGTLAAGDRLVVFKSTTAAVRAINLNTNRGTLKISTTGQTHGHSAIVDAFCVAAIAATGTPFIASNTIESFSSDGPRRMFFDSTGGALVPGSKFTFADNKFTTRQKPDITAADGVSTTLAASSGLNPFYGTSAAAPHAAAIAALLKSANPSLTPAQIRTYLTSTALDIQTTGYDINSGYGVVQAYQAMQTVNPTPLATINLTSATFTEGTGSNGNGSIDAGEVGNLVIQLNNPSLTGATNVIATVTTATPGVTITQGTASYGNLASGASGSNITVPFTFSLSPSVVCGSTVILKIGVSFGGGLSPVGLVATVVVSKRTILNVSSTLGLTPPIGTGYTAAAGQQIGRISRITSGITSTCDAPIANPGLTVTTGSRQYDAYTLNNNTGASQCYTATITSANASNLYSAAYSPSFIPTNPSTNYLAEPAQGATVMQYSFTVAAGANFTVVVHDVNETPASNSAYNLTLTYQACACLATLVTNNADDGLGSLRYIIANSCANPVITFASNVTNITLTSGELAINKAMTITGNGANALTISGNKLSRIFNINTGTSTVSISGMTIRDGVPQTGTLTSNATNGGGGILINSGTVNLTSCTVTNNNSSLTAYTDGGGIDNEGSGALTINNCTISNNTADLDGGGISYFGTNKLTINNSAITGNKATGLVSGYGYGGGIDNEGSGTVTITNSTITNNTADLLGGGISHIGDSLTISTSTISGNKATGTLTGYGYAGGFDNEGIGPVTINNSTISNNTADLYGGGIAQWSKTSMVLNNSTVTGNVATGLVSKFGGGGGIFVDSLITITNSTIYGNSGYLTGGNIFNNGTTAKAFTSLGNTIVGGGTITTSSPASYGKDVYSNIASAGYNLIQNAGGYIITGTTTGNLQGINPKLFALGNYGGTTPTMLPMSNSPVVNAGNIALTTGTDQRGLPRVIGGRADIGAVETNYVVTAAAGTPQATIIKTAFATALQAKVTESGNNIAGDSVTFVTSTVGTSATFANSLNTITVTTNAAGIATAPITANGVIGSYAAIASIGTAYSTVSYALTNNLAATSPITVFPNPVVNSFIVGLPGTDVQTVNIYDILGRQMAQYAVNGGNLLVNTSGWSKGMYLLTVTKGGSRIFTIKLIKQ